MANGDARAHHVTATGGEVSMSLPGFPLEKPATSHVIAMIDEDRQEFVTGTRRFARWAAEHAAGLDLTLSYRMAGGRLLAGSAPAEGARDQMHTAVAWIGRRWSVYMFSANGSPESLIEVLSLVDLDEERDGLTLHPKARDLRWEEPAQLTKAVPSLGLFDVAPMHAAVRRRIPRWAGTPARGGEVYVDRSNPDQTVYTVANSTSATRLLPDRTARRAALERGLARVRVSHRGRGGR